MGKNKPPFELPEECLRQVKEFEAAIKVVKDAFPNDEGLAASVISAVIRYEV
jgi:hypothetical protein